MENKEKEKKKEKKLNIRTLPAELFFVSAETAKNVVKILKKWKLLDIPGVVCAGPGPQYYKGIWNASKASIWFTFNTKFDPKKFKIPDYVNCQVNAWKGEGRNL